jgi:hypothetical protein
VKLRYWDQLALRVQKDQPDLKAQLALQGQKDQLDLKAQLEQLDQKVPQVLLETRERLV